MFLNHHNPSTASSVIDKVIMSWTWMSSESAQRICNKIFTHLLRVLHAEVWTNGWMDKKHSILGVRIIKQPTVLNGHILLLHCTAASERLLYNLYFPFISWTLTFLSPPPGLCLMFAVEPIFACALTSTFWSSIWGQKMIFLACMTFHRVFKIISLISYKHSGG